MNEFMRRAVELAVGNVREGGQPFGAVIVRDGEVVAEGVNELHVKHDVSGHAELLAMRRAQERDDTASLEGYVMYASGEPCSMCFTAMAFAGMSEVYYAQPVEDAVAAGLGRSMEVYEDLARAKEERVLRMERMALEDGIENPMRMWKDRK